MSSLATSLMAPPAATTADAAPLPPILGTYKRQTPLLVRGEGVYVWDDAGRRYLDLVAGIAVVSLGHGDAGVRQAIEAQLATGLVHTSNLYRTGPGEALAAWLVAHTFADSVFFCNSGAEANEGAMKFARRWGRATGHEGKVEIVALRGAFHGRLPGTLAATDRAAYRLPFEPLMGGVRIVERDLAALDAVLDPARTAAVIVEPIQGEGGVRVLDAEFLRGVRALTQERQVLLILDEIQCGLGRTGHFLAHEGVGVTPDILTVAKPLANGLPMGAILVSEAVGRAMQPGDHGTTFGGGPLLAAAALHVVQRLADPALLAHVREVGAWFGEQLRGVAARTGVVREVRGTGLMWGMDTHAPVSAIVGRAFDRGVLLVGAGEHTLRFVPPLVIGKEALAEGVAVVEAVLREVGEG